MNANLYLERIGISPAEVAHTYAFLKKLQESHICTVPYENLDILNAIKCKYLNKSSSYNPPKLNPLFL